LLSKKQYLIAKRIFDIVVSCTMIIPLMPFYFVIMVAIKASSKGPVFYYGERIGLNNKNFRIYKFRTMIPDAELSGTTTTLDDPRITRIGKLLRKYKIDELPQLFNVLFGDMSFVGPRPEVEEHTNAYNEEEKEILSVKPGITDYSSIEFYNLAEVLGPDNPHQIYVSKIRSQKNRLRLQYVKNQSFFEDMKILFNTSKLLIRLIFAKLKEN
jgi:lipopolysaccharide/colanic/teichoic acid biosynthesis glycosyltransferase